MRIKHAPFLIALLSLFSIYTYAAPYTIKFTGSTSSTTPEFLGVGQAHGFESSNYLQWMKYLKPTAVRYFITSINDWKNFITSRSSSAWGSSFTGSPVSSQPAWELAVQGLRAASSSPNSPHIFDWIMKDTSIRWSQFITILNTTNTESDILECLGNPTSILKGIIQQLNATPLAIWHVTCSNFKLTTTDRTAEEYWKERWELYRWFYLGGRFLVENGVRDIELYNEPDKESCLTAAYWIDEMTIRSLALQDAYADHSSLLLPGSAAVRPVLIAPPMSAPRYDPGTASSSYGKLAVQNRHVKFPGTSQSHNGWNNFQEVSYHQYNSPGYGMRSAYDKFKAALRKDAVDMPIRITEHNCYSAGNADAQATAASGGGGAVDIMDRSSTAACVANQISTMISRPKWMSLQKFSQTYSKASSTGVAQNGIFWADLGVDEDSNGNTRTGACDIGGSTKTGEAYRLLLSHTPGSKKLYSYTVTPPIPKLSNFSFYAVDDDQAYYLYSINAASTEQSMALDLTKLPYVSVGSPIFITAVNSSLHGEIVDAIPTVSTKKMVSVMQPENSVYMMKVPKGNLALYILPASQDTSLAPIPVSPAAGSSSACTMDTLAVEPLTGTSPPSIAVVAFDPEDIKKMANGFSHAILRMKISSIRGGQPHILTVLGASSSWSGECSLTWENFSNVVKSKDNLGSDVSIENNFINWSSSKPPTILGHVTAAKAGAVVSLDVTDYLKNGGSPIFVFSRLVRYDRRGNAMQGDIASGGVNFYSKESTNKPVLHLLYHP